MRRPVERPARAEHNPAGVPGLVHGDEGRKPPKLALRIPDLALVRPRDRLVPELVHRLLGRPRPPDQTHNVAARRQALARRRRSPDELVPHLASLHVDDRLGVPVPPQLVLEPVDQQRAMHHPALLGAERVPDLAPAPGGRLLVHAGLHVAARLLLHGAPYRRPVVRVVGRDVLRRADVHRDQLAEGAALDGRAAEAFVASALFLVLAPVLSDGLEDGAHPWQTGVGPTGLCPGGGYEW